MDENCPRCNALSVRIDALERMLDEREERVKERFVAMERTVTVALASSDKALTKAEDATEKRFDGVNHVRTALADQAATLLPRLEYAVQYAAVTDRIVNLERRIGTTEDRGAGKSQGLGLVAQGLLILIAFISMAAAVATATLRVGGLH